MREFDESDAAAPPMANGELVFQAPWEGRVFGMAQALADARVFEWDAFRDCLISSIAEWEAAHDSCEYAYYERFLQALERVLADRGIVLADELSTRTAEFEARPHGHDHHHSGDAE